MKLTLPENTKSNFTVKVLKSGRHNNELKRLSRGDFAKSIGLTTPAERNSAECFRLWKAHVAQYEADVSHVRAEAKKNGITDTNMIVRTNPETGKVERIAITMTVPKEDAAAGRAKALEDELAKVKAELAALKGLPAPTPAPAIEPEAMA